MLISLFVVTNSPSSGLTLRVIFFSPGVWGMYFKPVIGAASAPSGTFTWVLATGTAWPSTSISTSIGWPENPRALRLPRTSSTFLTNTVGAVAMSCTEMSRDPAPAVSDPSPTVTTGIC